MDNWRAPSIYSPFDYVLRQVIWLVTTARNAVVVIGATLIAFSLRQAGYEYMTLVENLTPGYLEFNLISNLINNNLVISSPRKSASVFRYSHSHHLTEQPNSLHNSLTNDTICCYGLLVIRCPCSGCPNSKLHGGRRGGTGYRTGAHDWHPGEYSYS